MFTLNSFSHQGLHIAKEFMTFMFFILLHKNEAALFVQASLPTTFEHHIGTLKDADHSV